MARSGKVRVLVIDDDQDRGQAIQRCLSKEFDISVAPSEEAAKEILGSQEFDVLMGANDLSPRSEVDAPAGDADASASKASEANLRNGGTLREQVSVGSAIGHPSTVANGNARNQEILADVVSNVIDSGRSLDAAMAEIEAAVIRAALKQQQGNRSAAARQLQLPRQTLQDRMKKHGLWSS